MTVRRYCRCCGIEVRIQCETDYCGARCRRGKCGHPRTHH